MAAGKLTVLVVDDDPSVLSVTQAILRSRGYAVAGASSGAQALQIAKERHAEIGLLLTDVRMPHMTGPELVEEFARIAPGTECALMSGYSDISEDYGLPLIRKPFTASDLVARVQEILFDSCDSDEARAS